MEKNLELIKLRSLLVKLCIDGDVSICDTCIHSTKGIGYCPYIDGSCNDKLSRYEPNEEIL